MQPARIVEDLERDAELPRGSEERFFGYGVMGLPFRSGHVLGLWRFPASSIGPGYGSVWHRDPAGRWTFYQDQPAELACTRYFGGQPLVDLGGAQQHRGRRRRRPRGHGTSPRAGSPERPRHLAAGGVRDRARVLHQPAV